MHKPRIKEIEELGKGGGGKRRLKMWVRKTQGNISLGIHGLEWTWNEQVGKCADRISMVCSPSCFL